MQVLDEFDVATFVGYEPQVIRTGPTVAAVVVTIDCYPVIGEEFSEMRVSQDMLHHTMCYLHHSTWFTFRHPSVAVELHIALGGRYPEVLGVHAEISLH